jgi:hypothetical protein
MGHVVNARGLRLGWTHNWCDHWFSELQFYPECLHSIFRVRFFLVYFFNLKLFEKHSFFYSHFEVVKYYKQFYVNIFYYDGKLEGLFDDLIFSYFIEEKEYKKQTDPEDRVWLGQFVALRFLYIFFLFSDYFTKIKGAKKKATTEKRETLRKYQIKSITYRGRTLLYALRKLKLPKIKRYIKNFVFRRRLRNKRNIKLLFFFTLYILFGFLKKKKKPKSRIDRFLLRLFFFFFGFKFVFPALSLISTLLKFIFTYIASSFCFKVCFYLINNESVTAKFISRYIAKKFKQNYTIRELLKPILVELVRSGQRIKEGRRHFGSFSSTHIKGSFLGSKNLSMRQNIFKNILVYVFSLHSNYSSFFFKKYGSWFSLGMLPLYIWLKGHFKHLLVSASLKYFIKRCAFSYFFSGVFVKQATALDKLLLYGNDSRASLSFSPKLPLGGFFNFIYEDFFLNKNLIFKIGYKLSYSAKSFLYSQKFLNRFINYNFHMYNYALKSSVMGYNNLKERIKTKRKMDRGLNGFKIHCIGRFSRKQRRSSIWFSRGKVPLSSISANIDYAFYTIPQKNSAVTIRVWLNDDRVTKWFLKAI